MGYDNFARLSERDKVKVNKIVWCAFGLSGCLCFFATYYVVIQVWHWPGWLAWFVAPLLWGMVWFTLTAGPLLGIVYLADASQKASRKASEREAPASK